MKASKRPCRGHLGQSMMTMLEILERQPSAQVISRIPSAAVYQCITALGIKSGSSGAFSAVGMILCLVFRYPAR